jgi:hypothetical protein
MTCHRAALHLAVATTHAEPTTVRAQHRGVPSNDFNVTAAASTRLSNRDRYASRRPNR